MASGPDAILITGATGFVGRHLVEELAASGRPTVPLGRSACDLTDRAAVAAACAGKKFAGVVHLAARIPGLGDDALELMVRENLLATDNLLRATSGAGYFLYASTLDVYGTPRALPLTERSETDPVTLYAITKLAAEKLVRARTAASGTPCAILRLSQVYGPGDRPIKLIPKTIARVADGEVPVVYGDGGDLRDYVHVRDVGRAMAAALARRAEGVFNIATGHARSVLEVVRTILAASGRRPEDIAFKERQGPRVDLRFDTGRMTRELGVHPREEFDLAIAELCAAAGRRQ